MKNIFLRYFNFIVFIFCIFSFSKTSQANTFNKLYGKVIYREELNDVLYNKSITDLQINLQKITGESFKVSSFDGKQKDIGIILLLNHKANLYDNYFKKLEFRNNEEFIINANSEKLIIIAKHPLGLSRGIYTYLDQLGVKWYFPGEIWTHVPSSKNITLSLTKYISPSFVLRDFFGTGGLYPVKIPESEQVKNDWEDWKRRNRIGGSVKLEGHYWETFNLVHEAELKKHPEYLAQIKGKRVQWSMSAKFCISNTSLQKLFVDDRIKYVQQLLASTKKLTDIIMIPVDPSDGGGHCECEKCKKLGTVSDRVFLLANLVARSASKISSRAHINLYAYNEHAAPPSIKLEKNVVVQIIPYAFQNVGTPIEMISLWKRKTNNLFIYDYYGLADWHFETPLTGRWSNSALVEKLNYWNSTGINGFLLESSYGLGTTGMGLYLMSRLGWDINENPDKIVQEFYHQMFSKGNIEVKNYFDKINNNFKGIVDVPYLYNQINKAKKYTSENTQVSKRLYILNSYVHFAVLYYQYKNSKNPVNDGSWERIMTYAWQLYPTLVIHTTRIAELLLQNTDIPKKFIDDWNLNSPSNNIQRTNKITNKELDKYVNNDMEKYGLLKDFEYVRNSVQYNFIPLKSNSSNTKEFTFLEFPEVLINMSKEGTFQFSIRTNPTSENNDLQQISILLIDPATGKDVWKQEVQITKNWSKVTLKQNAGRDLQLLIKNTNWINLSFDKEQWVYLKNITTYSYPGKLWFYIPEGKSFFYFKNTGDINPLFFDPNGNEVKPFKVYEEGVYQLPVKISGWWSTDNLELKFLEFYMTPEGFFPHPFYLVKKSQ